MQKQSSIPDSWRNLELQALEAKKAETLSQIYHRSHDLAWSGKDVLPQLIAKHGKPSLPQEQKEALARVFAIILWGELAAWKISCQIAAQVSPLEGKLAATSQMFDEARHFYTMYDYLCELGYVPEDIDIYSERLLDIVMNTDNLAYKILGMQLMVETTALVIFQTVRELNVEPVLAELLRYYELDEARHVGLGVHYLPIMIRKMSKAEVSRLMLFQGQIIYWMTRGSIPLNKDFMTLGIHPRKIAEMGRAKQYLVMKQMWGQLGIDVINDRDLVGRIADATNEVLVPWDMDSPMPTRVKKAWKAFFGKSVKLDEEYVHEAEVQLEGEDAEELNAAASEQTRNRKKKAAPRAKKSAPIAMQA